MNSITMKLTTSGTDISNTLVCTTICPTTGQSVEREGEQSVSLPDGQAVWWKCPICNGWHASIVDETSQSL